MCFIMNSFLHIYVANGAGNAHAIQVGGVKRQEKALPVDRTLPWNTYLSHTRYQIGTSHCLVLPEILSQPW